MKPNKIVENYCKFKEGIDLPNEKKLQLLQNNTNSSLNTGISSANTISNTKPLNPNDKFDYSQLLNQLSENSNNNSLDYKPQGSVITSSCDKYWGEAGRDTGDLFIDDKALVLKKDQLDLPKEKQFGDNNYSRGIINYTKLADLINYDKYEQEPRIEHFTDTVFNQYDKILGIERSPAVPKGKVNDEKIELIDKSTELLIDPFTKKKLNYYYELAYIYDKLNKDTWRNRWDKYNPLVKRYFDYNEIKSPIEDINILNKEFKKRADLRQKDILNNNELVMFGTQPFDIFKYKIVEIRYLNDDINKPFYIIIICLFREQELYINTFAYIGYIENNIPYIKNTEYIGRNSTDTILLPDFYNKSEPTYEIINKNFSNSPILNKDPDAVKHITKQQKEAYKIKNNYACFNLNYDASNAKDTYILPYYTRQECEAMYDAYGKTKKVGIFDKPCKKDDECPFYKMNKNYDNNLGGCMKDGKCQLPSNMRNIGFHYFEASDNSYPLCYNCDSKELKDISPPDNCCKEQNDTQKYGFLKSPDYAFDDDYIERKNYFDHKNYYVLPNNIFDLKKREPSSFTHPLEPSS